MKRPYDDVDYCGICPHIITMIYHNSHEDFQEGDENLVEDIFCGFFIWPIVLTREEYDNIPKWCPLDDVK